MRPLLVTTVLALILSACSSEDRKSEPSTPETTSPGNESTPAASDNKEQEASTEVVVNGEPLDDATLRQLEDLYKVKVKPGRYWYDPVSGSWGNEGGPTAGLMAPGHRLGGTLRIDASNGDTGVIVNGRELHQLDVLALRRCVQTIPGRYWVGANGIGGYEGGPAFFDLNAMCNAARGGGGGNTQCENYGAGQFNCTQSGTRTGAYGVIGEGGGQAGVYTDQGLIMTPN